MTKCIQRLIACCLKQQPSLECEQNKGDHCRLQEESHLSLSNAHQQHSSGGGRQHQVPGGAHGCHVNLDWEQHSSGKVSTVAFKRSLQDEGITPSPSHPHYFLQKHHREHHQLLLCVVRQLCRCRLEVLSGSGEDSGENILVFSYFHPGHWTQTLSVTDIIRDCTHPHHGRFSLLISGRRYCSVRSKTTRFCNSSRRACDC